MRVCLIAAVSENGVIGIDGDLPWRVRSDMLRFKRLTIGDGDETSAVIMGRKTWESLPDGHRPLDDRINIVLTQQTGWSDDGAEAAFYPGQAMEIAFSMGCEEAWIIGGAGTYAAMFDRVEEIHLTTIHANIDGDAYAKLDRSDWNEEIVKRWKQVKMMTMHRHIRFGVKRNHSAPSKILKPPNGGVYTWRFSSSLSVSFEIQ